MIDVKDRVPTYPGRVTMTPVPGQANKFDMVRSDEPTEPGTPINRALFEGIGNELDYLTATVNDLVINNATTKQVGAIPVYGEFTLYENGIKATYMKIDTQYGGVQRSLVLRQNLIVKMQYGGSSVYKDSSADQYLSGAYLLALEPRIQAALSPVPVLATTAYGDKTLTALPRKAFILSADELGITSSEFVPVGTAVEYFRDKPNSWRICRYNGSPAIYYTRSPTVLEMNNVGSISSIGSLSQIGAAGDFGIRPALTLPNDLIVDVAPISAANTLAAAELI